MNTPQTQASVEFTCKICKQPGVARFSIQCSQDWLDMLHPMLAHDKCYDRHVGFTKAGDRLVAACCELARSAKGSPKIAESLTFLARDYTRAFSEKHGTPLVFHEDFVDLLREKPEDVGRILSQYRKQVLSIQPDFNSEL